MSQALASGGNSLAVFAAARVSGPAELGSIALVVAFYAISVQLVRPLAGNVLQMSDLRSGSDRDRAFASGALLVAWVAACAGALAFLPVALALREEATSTAMAAVVGLVPFLVVHDTLRIWAISVQRASLAIVIDAAWLVLFGIVLLALTVRGTDTGSAIVVAWALSGAAVAVVAWAVVGVSRRSGVAIAQAWAAARRNGSVYLADAVLAAVSLTGFVLLLPLVAPVRDIGHLRAIEVPFGAVAMLGQACTLYLLPATRRLLVAGRPSRAWLGVGLGAAALAGSSLGLGALLLVLPEGLLQDVFGPSFTPTLALVVTVTVKFASFGAVLVASTMARSLGARRETLPFAAAYTVVGAVVGLLLARLSLELGYAALYLVVGIGSLVLAGRLRRRPFTPGTV